ncbi:ankyrin repeat-containing domain protein [Aspergillus granulosus]|uniref:Ankyrin repeat-containing domain protein n=1 Tax=Aspergillus granulosus TaxID=176169 RepID=A0ABR4GWR7_9EURO
MSIVSLPNELLLLIAAQLECRDLYALLRTHSSLYRRLIGCLYRWNLESRGFTALIWAAKRGSISTLQRFLDIGVDIGWKSWRRAHMSSTISGAKPRRATSMADTKRDHPICHATTSGRAEFVRKLIEHGADINFKDIDGRSPLALASRQGNIALVQMLISLGANRLSYDRFFHRPAANAASQGHHHVADYLLQELGKYPPVKLNQTIMGEKCTPLCGALFSAPRPWKIVKLLLDHGADPNIALPPSISNSGGWKPRPRPPLSLAMLREESLQLIKVLLKAGADARQCGVALFDAVRLEKAAEFRLLVDHHADLYVCLKGRSLAECAGQSDCQSIREACLGLDLTVPTRELARRTPTCCLRRRRQYLSRNDTILTIRTPALG